MSVAYKAQAGQSIFDIAMMTYGSLDNVIKLIRDTNGQVDNVSEQNLTGKTFNFDSDLITDVSLANTLTKTGRTYATAEGTTGGSFDDSFDISFD